MSTRAKVKLNSKTAIAALPVCPPFILSLDLLVVAEALCGEHLQTAVVLVACWLYLGQAYTKNRLAYFNFSEEHELNTSAHGEYAEFFDAAKVKSRVASNLKPADLLASSSRIEGGFKMTSSASAKTYDIPLSLALEDFNIVNIGGIPINLIPTSSNYYQFAESLIPANEGAPSWVANLAVCNAQKQLKASHIASFFAAQSSSQQKLIYKPIVDSLPFWSTCFDTIKDDPNVVDNLLSIDWVKYHTSVSSTGSLVVRAHEGLGRLGPVLITAEQFRHAESQKMRPFDQSLIAPISIYTIAIAAIYFDVTATNIEGWYSGDKAMATVPASFVAKIRRYINAWVKMEVKSAKTEKAADPDELLIMVKKEIGISLTEAEQALATQVASRTV